MADNEKKTASEAEVKAASEQSAAKSEKKDQKKNKVSFFSKIGKFFREIRSELKKVVWFGRKQTINSTILVVVAMIVSSLVISILDYGFSNAIMALGKLF